MGLKPFPGYALVELKKKYESGLSTEKEKYALNSEGTLLALGEPDESYVDSIGSTVYFTPYEDGEIIKNDGSEYVFVPVKSLRGVKANA